MNILFDIQAYAAKLCFGLLVHLRSVLQILLPLCFIASCESATVKVDSKTINKNAIPGPEDPTPELLFIDPVIVQDSVTIKWKNEIEGINSFKIVFAHDAACKNEERQLKDLTGTEVTISKVSPGTYYACLFAEGKEGEYFQAKNNGYKIVVKEVVVTPPAETPTATQYILLNPTDSVAGIATTITIEARDANHNVDVNFSSAVTLSCDGAATGCGIVAITNGIGTASVNSLVAETVNLSLVDHLASGLDMTSNQDVFFAPAAPASLAVSAGVESTSISWAAVAGADSYTIFWDDEAGITSSDSAIPNATATHNHLTLTPGTRYYYKIAALKNGVIGVLSA